MFEPKAGDLVWAKMRGFCPWPGRVMNADECKDMKRPSAKKPMQPVFFFGYKNHAWIEDAYIKPFFKFKTSFSNNKTAKFQESLKAIEDYIAEHSEAANKQKKREESTEGSKTPKTEKEEKKKETTPARQTPETKTEKGGKRKRSTNSLPPTETKKSKLSLSNNHSSQLKTKHPEKFYNMDLITPSVPRKSTGAKNYLERPSLAPRPDVAPLDLNEVSKALAAKKIEPTTSTIGFIGLGNMGSGIVKNLLHAGHKVNIWNRTSEKCDEFVRINASKVMTPQDVVASSDIIFCCVSDPKASQEMVFGNCGVLSGMEEGKSYIELTTIDEATSKAIGEAVTSKGGQYLEAQIQGNRRLARDGNLIILASGSRQLFDDAQSCIQSMSRKSFYVGETVGAATRMNLVIQAISGANIVALAEGMAIATKAGLAQKDIMEIFGKTLNASQLLMEKIHDIVQGEHDPGMAVSLMQKDLTLALKMGDVLLQPMPMTAAANEVYKHTRQLGYSDHDVSSVYLRYKY